MDYFAEFPFYGRPRLLLHFLNVKSSNETKRSSVEKFFTAQLRTAFPGSKAVFKGAWPKLNDDPLRCFMIGTFESKVAGEAMQLIEHFDRFVLEYVVVYTLVGKNEINACTITIFISMHSEVILCQNSKGH